MGVLIKSFGHFIPKTRVTNFELAKRFNVTSEWIVQRTGIEERKYFLEGATSDMIVNAASQCLLQTEIPFTAIDCVIVATMTPDHLCPSTAAIVHNKLSITNAWGFDIMAACSGYLYALQLATSLINSGSYKTILVCGADKMSSCIDPNDRKTVLLLSDGAGVSLLQYSPIENSVIDIICKLHSSNTDDIVTTAGGSSNPNTTDTILRGEQFLRFKSKSIFEMAISLMQRVIDEIMLKNKMTLSDIDFIVPHQANKRLIEVLANKLCISIDRFIINVEQIGNTGAGTIPIAISEAIQNGKLKGNERLLMVAVGAGYTYASSLVQLNQNQYENP